MREQWPLVALADVTNQRRTPVRVEPGRVYPLLGVRWYGEGPFLREVVTSESSKATRLFEVHEDDFIYNRLFAYKGSFGRVPKDLAGSFVSNEFPLFTCQAGLLDPRFLELHFQQQPVWSLVEQESVGTTASRSRWKEEDFARHRIALPPLQVQRRIVDLIGTIDAHVRSLSAEIDAMTTVLRTVIEVWHIQSAKDVALPTLGDLAVIRSGPSWAAAEESAVPSDGATRVIKITNTKQDGSLDLTDRTYVTGLPARTLLLDDRSLIVIRTNGNRNRIGNVYRPSPDALGYAVSAFQFIVQATDSATRDRIYWALRAPSAQLAMSDAASGTTGLGNLAAGWLKAQPIAELNEKTRLAFEDTNRELSLLHNEHEGLGAVRTQLLQGLLSREVELPEAYDRLMDAGVA